MALGATGGGGKGGLAIVAGSTGLALGHVCHGLPLTASVGVQLGVAVITLIGGGMEVVVEVADQGSPAVFEGQVGRLVADVTFVTVTACSKGGLAVVAGAAGFTFFHLGHGGLAGTLAVVEALGMTVVALVNLAVEVVTEYGVTDRLGFILEGLGGKAAVAGTTVGCYREGLLAVVAGAAGLALFHLGHAYTASLGAGTVAALAAITLAMDMGVVTKGCIAGLNLIDAGGGYGAVAAQTILLGRYIEGFFAVVTGSAGFALFHLGHSVAAML